MKTSIFALLLIVLASLTSCIEIVDDLTINNDGTGKLNYTVNLSASKVKIGSILALDSLNGHKVPSLPEIKAQINTIADQLKMQNGISAVTHNADLDNYILKFTVDFNSLSALQSAIKKVLSKELKNNSEIANSADWISFDSKQLTKAIPEFIIKKAVEVSEKEKTELAESKYTSIIRFESEILSHKNQYGKIAKNKKAYLIQSDVLSLIQNRTKLNETIIIR